MGRPRGSRNKPKTVPTSDGITSTKDNMEKMVEALPDEQRQVIFFQNKRLYKEAKARLQEKIDDVKDERKSFNSLKKRIAAETPIDQIELAIALESDTADAALQAEIEAKLRIARWMGAAVGTQFEMFPGPDRTRSVDRAWEAGKRDALSGEAMAPQAHGYAPATPQWDHYGEGYRLGQEAVLRGIKARAEAGPAPDNEVDVADLPLAGGDPLPGAEGEGSYAVG